MKSRPATRPHPQLIAQDRATLLAIKSLPDYTPMNALYSVAMLSEAESALSTAQERVSSLLGALAHARAELDIAAHSFHEGVLGARLQVLAQYGTDSPTVQAIGLTRKSARRRPTRRASTEL